MTTKSESSTTHNGKPSVSFTRPEVAVFGMNSMVLDSVMQAEVSSRRDAMSWPDNLQIVYTFKFPAAAKEFRKLFSTDFNIFATDQWVSGFANNRVNVNVLGFGQWTIKCPFVPKALVVSVDADAYAYCIPVGRVNAAFANDANATPSYTEGSGVCNAGTVQGELRGNALFRHGVFTNLIRQYLLMGTGIRVEFDCDGIILDYPMRAVGLASSYVAPPGATVLESYQQDLSDLNFQLKDLNSPYRYVSENAQNSGYGDLEDASFEKFVVATPNGTQEEFDGTIPIRGVMLLAGQGLDIIVYTIPGLEHLRDQLLAQAEIVAFNIGHDLPTKLAQDAFNAIWRNLTEVHFVLLDGTEVVVNFNESIPNPTKILRIERDGNGFKAIPTVPAYIGPVVITPPDYGPGSASPDQPFPTADLDIFHYEREVGSQATELINHGELQMSFTLYGTYVPKKMYLDYFNKFAVSNPHLRELILSSKMSRDVLSALLIKYHDEFGVIKNEAESLGIHALESLRLAESTADED